MVINMIEETNLFSRRQSDARSTSIGNQNKWESDGYFYKADYLGYEGLSEVIACQIAKQTNLTQYPIVMYEPFAENNIVGCKSKLFTSTTIREQTLYRALRNAFSTDLAGVYEIYRNDPSYAFVSFYEFILDFINSVFCINLADWCALVFQFDALIFNTDRHFNNITFLQSNGHTVCPVFDNGAAFFSDLRNYPIESNILSAVHNAQAKPFYTDFQRQIQEAAKHSSAVLSFNSSKIVLAISDLADYYDLRILQRVQRIVEQSLAGKGVSVIWK